MLQEFKKFLMRGNVIDLAVGLVIGAAFTAVVTSFVNDLLMPPIGRLLGRANFTDLFVSLDSRSFPSLAAAGAGSPPTAATSALNSSATAFSAWSLPTSCGGGSRENRRGISPAGILTLCAARRLRGSPTRSGSDRIWSCRVPKRPQGPPATQESLPTYARR